VISYFERLAKTESVQRVFENRKISGPARVEVTGDWRNCITRSFMIFALRQMLFGLRYRGRDANGRRGFGGELNYVLTPWSRVLPVKLAGPLLVKKLPVFHET
jgi:hypothetical protein